MPPGVRWHPRFRTVVLRGARGDLVVSGSGPANAVRSGPGVGSAIRLGAGHGNAVRREGDGDAVREGTYLESARARLEPLGFVFERGQPRGGDVKLGEYRLKTPSRRTSVYVQAPVTRTGRSRAWGSSWRWRSPALGEPWKNAVGLDALAASIVRAHGRLPR